MYARDDEIPPKVVMDESRPSVVLYVLPLVQNEPFSKEKSPKQILNLWAKAKWNPQLQIPELGTLNLLIPVYFEPWICLAYQEITIPAGITRYLQ
jgi:hypothetical protein